MEIIIEAVAMLATTIVLVVISVILIVVAAKPMQITAIEVIFMVKILMNL